MGESHRLFNTKCVLEEGEKLGSRVHGAMMIARTFETRNCGHKEAISADECIKSLVSSGNLHGLFVASQDTELRSGLRRLPGIPILHVNHNVIVLEKPSRKSVKISEKQDDSKLLTDYQKELLASLRKTKDASMKVSRKRKGPKGPNPLSVKKKKKVDGDLVKLDKDKKTTRARRKRKKPSIISE